MKDDMNKKFIFIHIPKTAGITIRNILSKYDTYQFKNNYTGHKCDANWWFNHLGEHEFNKNFLFTTIRNPFDRLVSIYFYYLNGGNQGAEDKKFGEIFPNNFKDFILDIDNIDYVNRHCIFKEIWKNVRPTEPQYTRIFNNTNVKNDHSLYLIKFENLQEDFDIVCNKIGIPIQKLPHKNKTKHKHYTKYYDDETKEIVAEKYAKDIKYFGYEFGES
jgi:hypothetical protein